VGSDELVVSDTYLKLRDKGRSVLSRSNRSKIAIAATLASVLGAVVTGSIAQSTLAFAAAATAPHFTFVIDSSWTAEERAQLESWLTPSGPVMEAVRQVSGPPSEDLTVTITKGGQHAGEYGGGRISMYSLQLSTLVHELNHATRNRWILSNPVWEEGLARAAEVETMDLLAQKGINETSYNLYHHSYQYDEYYDQDNVAEVAAPYGNLYNEPGLELLRYEQAGYTFGKALIENPGFVADFNGKLFARPDGRMSQTELVALAQSVQHRVEGQRFDSWQARQHIFDTDQQEGCYVFQRANQFTVDVYCTDRWGAQTAQFGVTVNLKILDVTNAVVFQGSGVTTSYGWTSFAPNLAPGLGRIKVIAEAASSSGSIRSVIYRQAGPAEGVFGVVPSADRGTVTFSSHSGQFATFSVPVTNGAFAAPSLGPIRGQIRARFRGEGRSARRTFDKDAAPYGLVLDAS
jgi:hypothetical protein